MCVEQPQQEMIGDFSDSSDGIQQGEQNDEINETENNPVELANT